MHDGVIVIWFVIGAKCFLNGFKVERTLNSLNGGNLKVTFDFKYLVEAIAAVLTMSQQGRNVGACEVHSLF